MFIIACQNKPKPEVEALSKLQADAVITNRIFTDLSEQATILDYKLNGVLNTGGLSEENQDRYQKAIETIALYKVQSAESEALLSGIETLFNEVKGGKLTSEDVQWATDSLSGIHIDLRDAGFKYPGIFYRMNEMVK